MDSKTEALVKIWSGERKNLSKRDKISLEEYTQALVKTSFHRIVTEAQNGNLAAIVMWWL